MLSSAFNASFSCVHCYALLSSLVEQVAHKCGSGSHGGGIPQEMSGFPGSVSKS